MRTIKFIFIFLFITFVSASVAQQKTIQETESGKLIESKETFPGLDKKILLKAASIFAKTDVPEISKKIAEEYYNQAQEMKAICDSLWTFMGKEERIHTDSTEAYNWYSKAMDYLRTAPYEFGSILKKAKKYGRLDSTVIKELVFALIPQISKTYGNAIRYNPFHIPHRYDFASFLKSGYEKTGDLSLIDQAIEQHHSIIELRKGFRPSYKSLGDLYYIKEECDNAYQNYHKAAEILEKSGIFALKEPELYFDRLSEVPIDTNLMVSYLSYQAESKIHLYEATPALALLRKARKLTPTPKLKNRFKNRIKWILWDDGNIRASELRDQAFEIFSKGQYENAKNSLLELLNILWTKRTKDEINYRIAQIDFTYLQNEEEGVARLFQLITHSKTDSLTGVPVDSMYQQYFDSFGKMCFKRGSDFLDKDQTYAYVYFMQAADIAYDEQAKAYIQLADLSLFNPRESINLCKKALKHVDYLEDISRDALYQTLYKAYRKLGDFAEARKWFDKSNSN